VKTIKTNTGPYLQIQEIDSKGFFTIWSIMELLDSNSNNQDHVQVLYESLLRTKKWIKENHPELLI
jgi:hypothetical protein